MLCGRGEPQHKPSADYQLTEEEKKGEGHFRTGRKSGGCEKKKNDRQETTMERKEKETGRLENEADSWEVGEKKMNRIQHLNQHSKCTSVYNSV